jgi:RNA polymerase sigma-70 factor (ECF subfamily)
MDARRLFEQHHGALYRYLVRLTGDEDVAEDAAQETFVRLITRPPRNEHPRAWLFAVATNLVRSWANSRKRRHALLVGAGTRAPAADPWPTPIESIEASERRETVRRALDDLSDKERVILLMREEGFSHKEIAGAIGTTTGSVGTMIARALDKLASALPLDADAL